MVEEPGSQVLFLNDARELAISESSGRSPGNQVVLYGGGVARGLSSPAVKQDALLISGNAAQTGPATARVTISDSQGESKGTVTLTQRAMDIADYCGYGAAGKSAVSGDISDELLEVGVTSFLLYENTNTGDRFFGFFHDAYDPGAGHGGTIHWDISGIPDTAATVVEDDPDHNQDVYDFANNTITHQWSDPNTDGVAIGTDADGSVNDAPSSGFSPSTLDGVTVTFDVSEYSGGDPPTNVRFIGDDGTTVERAYDGTNTTVEITF
jgi:hypothetical protein